jgi:hypothetical protein
MRIFQCQHCGQVLYFENQKCEKCSYTLGYLPEAGVLSALEPSLEPGIQPGVARWRALASAGSLYRFCANAELSGCNWLVPEASPETFCAACRHNRTIPDLTVEENGRLWRKLESAKRRMFYTLIRLRLPLPNRQDDPEKGLVFDFLAEAPGAGLPEVMTGHENGLITINLKEADDAEREKLRNAMGETYRTLLGHFRHEIGHYFWDRLVEEGGKTEAFRELFGDERLDYGEAVKAHYASGPPAGWQESYISSYATTHPWEDFAETWAHYLHIVDTLEMASAFGLRVEPSVGKKADLSATVKFDPYERGDMNRIIQAWLPLAIAVNAINRCMGEPDLYPFVLTPRVIEKLDFIHKLVHETLVHEVPAKPAEPVPAGSALQSR